MTSSAALTPYATPLMVDTKEGAKFYHSMDLPGGETLVGEWDLRGQFDRYVGGYDFAGKRLLDMGTASGFLSFEAEKRGAEVVSFDLAHGGMLNFLPGRAIADPDAELDRQKRGYWYCHQRLGARARVCYGDPLALDPRLGRFDMALIGNVLVHARDPLGLLEATAACVDHDLILVEHVLELTRPIAGFAGQMRDVWWNFSPAVYQKLFDHLGFDMIARQDGEYILVNGLRIKCATLTARRRAGR